MKFLNFFFILTSLNAVGATSEYFVSEDCVGTPSSYFCNTLHPDCKNGMVQPLSGVLLTLSRDNEGNISAFNALKDYGNGSERLVTSFLLIPSQNENLKDLSPKDSKLFEFKAQPKLDEQVNDYGFHSPRRPFLLMGMRLVTRQGQITSLEFKYEMESNGNFYTKNQIFCSNPKPILASSIPNLLTPSRVYKGTNEDIIVRFDLGHGVDYSRQQYIDEVYLYAKSYFGEVTKVVTPKNLSGQWHAIGEVSYTHNEFYTFEKYNDRIPDFEFILGTDSEIGLPKWFWQDHYVEKREIKVRRKLKDNNKILFEVKSNREI